MPETFSTMPHGDGVIRWPGNAKLRSILADAQRLNPRLGLRGATTETGGELLLYARPAADLVEIVFPEPVADSVMIGLTYANRDWYPLETDLGTVRLNARRFDRTATGTLVVRPQSDAVSDARNRFSIPYHLCLPALSSETLEKRLDLKSQLVRRWVIPTGAWQLWEVEFGFLPAGHLDTLPEAERDWWATVPIGTISFSDRYDIPLTVHHDRAREIVARGAQFALVGDLGNRETLVFRASGIERFSEDFCLPEMNWFTMTVGVP